MLKSIRIFSLIAVLPFLMSASCSPEQLASILNVPLTKEEISRALKDALVQGIRKGTTSASQNGGYFNNSLIKIPFPRDAQNVADKLRQIGLGGEVDKFVRTLNRGAEEAAKEATPIFIDAVKSMSIQDAYGILKGDKDAATKYLQRVTTSQLQSKFQPVISRNLQKVNATRFYGDLVGKYNKIPLVRKVNPDLDEYATELAIEGLFKLVAQEEANIRQNISARSTALMKKVFAQAPQAR